MKKILVITVAGTSSRFRESLGYDILKCLYKAANELSIIERLLALGIKNNFDKIVIVGGYKFDDLKTFIETYDSGKIPISLIYNEKYDTFGSNYSLYLGLVEALKENSVGKVVFAEGDLIFDEISFERICNSASDVITVNNNEIVANKSVVFYTNVNDKVKYCYDPKHSYLEIKEPFTAIFNSAQIWSFHDLGKLRDILANQTERDLDDTNLNIIQKYFNSKIIEEIELVTFQQWFNCNTADDYSNGIKGIKLWNC